jgi:UDP-N-acetylmuramyl pentapeptide phosphotransferase/UDP-N-acetylglucosamine-1-phosphate transferase
MQMNAASFDPVLPHTPVFVLSLVLIPVFDTIRAFAIRTWKGKSPFVADKTHIHHLLTNQGFSHGFAAKLICFINGFFLLEAYWLRWIRQEYTVLILFVVMLMITQLLKKISIVARRQKVNAPIAIYTD